VAIERDRLPIGLTPTRLRLFVRRPRQKAAIIEDLHEAHKQFAHLALLVALTRLQLDPHRQSERKIARNYQSVSDQNGKESKKGDR